MEIREREGFKGCRLTKAFSSILMTNGKLNCECNLAFKGCFWNRKYIDDEC